MALQEFMANLAAQVPGQTAPLAKPLDLQTEAKKVIADYLQLYPE